MQEKRESIRLKIGGINGIQLICKLFMERTLLNNVILEEDSSRCRCSVVAMRAAQGSRNVMDRVREPANEFVCFSEEVKKSISVELVLQLRNFRLVFGN